jgi:hypothetical protein
MPGLVNGQAQSLSSVNQSASGRKLKDSVKADKKDVAQLISITLERGAEGKIGNNLAPVIGLPHAMPMRKQEVVMPTLANKSKERAFYVIYENADGTPPKSDQRREVCAYIVKIELSGLDKKTQYFRIDLDGKLEKAILSQGKLDSDGNGVKGSGVKTDQDINSPEVKKTFEAEMKFWLKDWLNKEQKNAAKKTANAATPPTATPAH